ncbi:MAG: hypothetical protein FWD79_10490 [Desulfobulbus sp.]|nr:hypothetical protein [Desulfobulbus sp.]
MKTKLSFASILFCFIVLHPIITLAGDVSRLCGIVQQVNTAKGTVTINVVSSSCPGTQAFQLPNAQAGALFHVDEMKCFIIDSDQCADTAMHKITEIDDRN